MTDPKLEQEARELLATACGERVEDMLYDRPGFVAKDQAIRAIVAALSQQRAVPEVTDEMVEIVGKQLWRYWGDVKGAAARTYRNKTRKALEDALAALQGESNAP